MLFTLGSRDTQSEIEDGDRSQLTSSEKVLPFVNRCICDRECCADFVVYPVIVLIVILFIVVSFIFTRLKSLEQRQARFCDLLQQDKRGGPVGLSVRQYGMPGKSRQASGRYRAAESRYAFVLARHVEQVIDQGLDRSVIASPFREQRTDRWLRGEVQSWLPQSYVQRFYRVAVSR